MKNTQLINQLAVSVGKISYLFKSIRKSNTPTKQLEVALLKQYVLELYDQVLELEQESISDDVVVSTASQEVIQPKIVQEATSVKEDSLVMDNGSVEIVSFEAEETKIVSSEEILEEVADEIIPAIEVEEAEIASSEEILEEVADEIIPAIEVEEAEIASSEEILEEVADEVIPVVELEEKENLPPPPEAEKVVTEIESLFVEEIKESIPLSEEEAVSEIHEEVKNIVEGLEEDSEATVMMDLDANSFLDEPASSVEELVEESSTIVMNSVSELEEDATMVMNAGGVVAPSFEEKMELEEEKDTLSDVFSKEGEYDGAEEMATVVFEKASENISENLPIAEKLQRTLARLQEKEGKTEKSNVVHPQVEEEKYSPPVIEKPPMDAGATSIIYTNGKFNEQAYSEPVLEEPPMKDVEDEVEKQPILTDDNSVRTQILEDIVGSSETVEENFNLETYNQPREDETVALELNDVLARNTGGKSGGNRHLDVSFNQRFAFINQLFKGDSGAYNKAVGDISSSDGYIQALTYVNLNLVHDYGWDSDDPVVKDFKEVIRKCFLD